MLLYECFLPFIVPISIHKVHSSKCLGTSALQRLLLNLTLPSTQGREIGAPSPALLLVNRHELACTCRRPQYSRVPSDCEFPLGYTLSTFWNSEYGLQIADILPNWSATIKSLKCQSHLKLSGISSIRWHSAAHNQPQIFTVSNISVPKYTPQTGLSWLVFLHTSITFLHSWLNSRQDNKHSSGKSSFFSLFFWSI